MIRRVDGAGGESAGVGGTKEKSRVEDGDPLGGRLGPDAGVGGGPAGTDVPGHDPESPGPGGPVGGGDGSSDDTPGDGTPGDGTPGDGTPGDGTPGDGGDADAPQFHPHLQSYSGPLDLLLYLINKNEVDVFDIPIALILDQYLEHVTVLERAGNLDLYEAGEFLVMASRLMEIKSRMLLPVDTEIEDDEPLEEEVLDPRISLVQQLLEYKEIKERAVMLEEAHRRRLSMFERLQHAELPETDEKLDLKEASVWDLFAAFQRVLSDLSAREQDVKVVEVEDVPIEEVIQNIVTILESSVDRSAAFQRLIVPEHGIQGLINTFLALLEMARLRLIRLRQSDGSADIEVYLRESS